MALLAWQFPLSFLRLCQSYLYYFPTASVQTAAIRSAMIFICIGTCANIDVCWRWRKWRYRSADKGYGGEECCEKDCFHWLMLGKERAIICP